MMDFQSQRAKARAGGFGGGGTASKDSVHAGTKASDVTAPMRDVESGMKRTPMGGKAASNQPWTLDQKIKRPWVK